MGQKTREEIRELNTREKKAWRVLDQFLITKPDKRISSMVRLEAAVFILKRLYPEKKVLEGTGENGEFKVTVEVIGENNPAQESGNRISQYLTV